MRYRKTTSVFFMQILLSMAGLSGAGEIYKWKDADGRIHYGDNPPVAIAETNQIKIQSTSPPPPTKDVQIMKPLIRLFDVRGGSPSELDASMLKSGPFDVVTQTRRWGMCHWKISWKFAHATSDSQCRIDGISLKLNAEIDLPHWVSRFSAPNELRIKWDRFEKALRIHEEGHRSNGIAATSDLARKLRTIPPQKDCASLNREISALGARVIADYRLLDQAYDRSTNHGITQGASFW